MHSIVLFLVPPHLNPSSHLPIQFIRIQIGELDVFSMDVCSLTIDEADRISHNEVPDTGELGVDSVSTQVKGKNKVCLVFLL
jgi:hypothetical protein